MKVAAVRVQSWETEKAAAGRGADGSGFYAGVALPIADKVAWLIVLNGSRKVWR